MKVGEGVEEFDDITRGAGVDGVDAIGVDRTIPSLSSVSPALPFLGVGNGVHGDIADDGVGAVMAETEEEEEPARDQTQSRAKTAVAISKQYALWPTLLQRDSLARKSK
jgi:hypothetical protein